MQPDHPASSVPANPEKMLGLLARWSAVENGAGETAASRGYGSPALAVMSSENDRLDAAAQAFARAVAPVEEPVHKEQRAQYERPAPQPVFAAPSAALSRHWPQVVADLDIEAGRTLVTLQTSEKPLSATGEFFVAHGRFGGEPVAACAPAAFFARLLNCLDPSAQPASAGSSALALWLELALRRVTQRIEKAAHLEVRIDSVDRVQGLPKAPWLALRADMDGFADDMGIAVGPAAMAMLEQFGARHANPTERRMNTRLDVKIGPIIMAAEDAYGLKEGSTVDCGVDPSGDVRGILERADGSWWPVIVEDEGFEITGEMNPPLAPRAAKGSAMVGVRIGSVELAHHRRLALGAGSRATMRRLTGNAAELAVGKHTLAHGHLGVVGSNLVVRISGRGAAE